MNFYSSDEFCNAFAAAYFPEETVENQWFELNGQYWKIPIVNQTTPITELPFQSKMLDFYEAFDKDELPDTSAIKSLKYLPKVCQRCITAEDWISGDLEAQYEPAPTIMWEDFADWDAFIQHVKQRKSKKFWKDSNRRRRKLEEEVGPLEFILGDDRPEILATCMAWKSEQYRNSGEFDDFAHEEHIRLFQELADRGLLMVSSLSSAQGPIAIDLNLYYEGRLYSWIASYDRAYSTYAPGRLLLLEALEESFKRGHKEFDFLIGNEPYKWIYATHARLISSLGQTPLKLQAKEWVTSSVKPFVRWSLQPFPKLKGKLKTLALLSQKS